MLPRDFRAVASYRSATGKLELASYIDLLAIVQILIVVNSVTFVFTLTGMPIKCRNML